MARSVVTSRPRLAFVYHPYSFPTLAIADAARGLCSVVWIIDTSHPRIGSMPALLRRLGTVVDVADLSEDEAARLISREHPDGILCLADSLLSWTARIASRTGLNFFTEWTANALSDKYSQRAALEAAGLPTPRYRVIDADVLGNIAQLLDDVPLPAVLKPRRGEGSRDTVSITSQAQLESQLKTLESRSRGRQYVLEEYLEDSQDGVAGEGFAGYVSVESIVVHGEIRHLAVTGRTPPAKPFRETGLFIPADLAQAQRSAVLQMAGRAAEALGITSGCLHTEIKLTPHGPVVIEVNGRVGGGLHEMLEAAFGIRILTTAMKIALDMPLALPTELHTDRVVYQLYSQPPVTSQHVRTITGIDRLRATTGVEDVVVRHHAGDAVNWLDGNHGYVFYTMGSVPDHQGLRDFLSLSKDLVTVEYD